MRLLYRELNWRTLLVCPRALIAVILAGGDLRESGTTRTGAIAAGAAAGELLQITNSRRCGSGARATRVVCRRVHHLPLTTPLFAAAGI
jgi:hypothetical protein